MKMIFNKKKAATKGRQISNASFRTSTQEDKNHPAYNVKRPDREPDFESDLFEFYLEENIVIMVHTPCLLSFCPVTSRAMYMSKYGNPSWVYIDKKTSDKVLEMIVEKTILK